MMGAGNFADIHTGKSTWTNFATLTNLGMRNCRIPISPPAYLITNDWNKPNPACLDRLIAAACSNNMKPIILIEWYQSLNGSIGFGNYQQWRNIGYAFAERFRPGGTWAQANGISNWGVTVYSAINEPERTWGNCSTNPRPMSEYYNALKGMADGVHAADPSLRALPGGFLAANAYNDWTLRGLGPLLAPLWNNGTLDGVDLHTYYDVTYAPIEGNRYSSSHYDFRRVKQDSGITRDIHFYCTEFNYKVRNCSEEQAARGFLTGIWDNLGVVGNDQTTGVTVFAMPWNVFSPVSNDQEYGMCISSSPWNPAPRGQVLQLVCQLTRGMQFLSFAPFTTGEFKLQGAGKTMWVWQNRQGWTSHTGTSFTVSDIPLGAGRVQVYGWDGLRKTVSLTSGQSACLITGLSTGETYMFLADSDGTDRADVDCDGVPDSWEQKYFSGTVQQADADADGDGLSNKEEYLAGTDPTDRNSILRVTMENGAAPAILCNTAAVSGSGYQGLTRYCSFEYKTNILQSSWLQVPGYEKVAITGSLLSCSIPCISDRMFFRNSVWLE